MAYSFHTPKLSKAHKWILLLTLVLSLLLSMAAVWSQTLALLMVPVLIVAGVTFIVLLFKEPFIGLLTVITYCFFLFVLSREVSEDIQFGLGTEALLLLTWLSVWYNAKRYDFSVLKNKLSLLCLVWFIISVLELVNPYGASPMGWLQEIRSTALLPLLLAPLGLVLITDRRRLNLVLCLIIIYSFLGVLNGMKQQFIGLSAGEQHFLDAGGSITHIVFGQLRVFSFYSHAGQFGPSQAQVAVLCFILALGLKTRWKKTILFILGGLFFYGMLISGTRGAFFALLGAAGSALFFARRYKVILWGAIVLALFVGVLKYTHIGSSNYNIVRLRSALDPNDPSLNVRFESQKILREYMASLPFGGGLGVIGTFGHLYNSDKFLSTIEPDSYWVKLWVMYGIVGFTIWFCILMYLLGRCFGIVWRVKDPVLKTKLIALGSGIVGLFICSYGNEVMNDIPSSVIIWLSFAIILNAFRIEGPEKEPQTS
ncbi:hypothetical protein GCM10027051_28170 [Niabella terrae]